MTKSQKVQFSGYQKFVVVVLAFLQFTIILDFMIMSPLGALMMPALNISPSQFGIVVSAYAFSAGISGILAAGFADRFDRKKFLLFFYSGFLIGTLLCGIAPTYEFLLAARMITGVFGGVIGSIVLAITTDLFSFEMRGRVMGFIQTAFAASQILGLPAGLYISNYLGWHAPFLAIVAIGVIAGIVIFKFIQPINSHLKMHPDKKAFHHLQSTLSNRRYVFAFLATALLSVGGFMLMPFGSAYTVNNLGIAMDKLPLMYLATGIVSIIVGPLIGRASDYFGKFPVFVFGAALTIVMVLVYTNLGVTPMLEVMIINAILYIGIFSRMIPAQALMSAIPDPASRGSFMAVSSSLQQISGGLASVVAGLIVIQQADGKIGNFPILGFILVGTTLITTIQMFFIHKRIPEKTS